ncbi:MAG: acylglycerol kinase family protein [Elusimicrobiales bacterium]|nr:acylglycerol kinase family protein [Elusimicrobiales bacterium]
MPANIFILNPAAGHGRAGRVWASLEDAALRLLPGSACAATGGPGHASELAREAVLAGTTRLIAVGGDGTFSEMLEGVMAAPEHLRRGVTLGAIPAGSGCDLARHLGYPADRDGLIDLLARNLPASRRWPGKLYRPGRRPAPPALH